jgi:hypothetical protein
MVGGAVGVDKKENGSISTGGSGIGGGGVSDEKRGSDNVSRQKGRAPSKADGRRGMVGGEDEGEGFLSYRADSSPVWTRLTEGEEATMDHTEPAEGDSATREGPRKHRSRAKRVLGFAAVVLVAVSALALAPVVVGAVLGLCIGVVLLLAVSGIPPSHTLRT